jgi:hypothetical protein
MWYTIFNLRAKKETRCSAPFWRSSGDICAFADDERHLGHVIRTDQWQAFDATKSNDAGDGFHYLGSYADVNAAREAVEDSVAPCLSVPEERVFHAGGF